MQFLQLIILNFEMISFLGNINKNIFKTFQEISVKTFTIYKNAYFNFLIFSLNGYGSPEFLCILIAFNGTTFLLQ